MSNNELPKNEANAKNNNGAGFTKTVESLFKGMDSFLSTKTVVGDPIQIGDTIILPLVDVSFGVGAGAFGKDPESSGGGGLGGKLTPSAVLVISNGVTKLVEVKDGSGLNKIVNLIPEVVDKIKGSDKKRSQSKSSDIIEETEVLDSEVEEINDKD